MMIFLNIWSTNPAHSRALLEASEGGAGCGACAFVPCKHGARAARGSALEHNDSTRSVRYRLMATTSAIAGNAPSDGSATPQAVQRRAERREALRSLPKRKGTRTSAVKPRRRAHLTEAPIGAPPPRLCRRDKTRRQGGKHDGQPRGRATPRPISHGYLTSESDESADAVG